MDNLLLILAAIAAWCVLAAWGVGCVYAFAWLYQRVALAIRALNTRR